MENSPDVCSACNASIQPGSKFCTECGKPVEELPKSSEESPKNDEKSLKEPVEEATIQTAEETQEEPIKEIIQETENSDPAVNCPQCNAKLMPDDKFCTECGAKIGNIKNCPKCSAPIPEGTKFCTECGTNVYEYKPDTPTTRIQTGNVQTEIPGTNIPPKGTVKSSNDPMDDLKETGMGLMKDVEKTGRGLMKDLGGFLDKSSKKSSKSMIKPKKKEQNFLVCDTCGGYYELQTGESPEDFSDECDCGGHLEHKNQHP